MTPEQEVERGRWAEEVLANPVYAEARELIEKGLIDAWRDASTTKEREEIHRTLKLLGKVHTLMAATMREGRVAKADLVRRQSLAERIGLRRG